MSEFDMLAYEKQIMQQGYKNICGVDEAGRGPLAGPVCAAAVILPPGMLIEGVNDSKKLSARRRTHQLGGDERRHRDRCDDLLPQA